MKKHIIAIIILVCILSLVGAGIWLVVRKNNAKPLYASSREFAYSTDTNKLIANITQAQDLYINKGNSAETRLNTLSAVVTKIDTFVQDLNSYLILSTAKPSSTNKLSKSYKNLEAARSVLLTDYSEYITRMSGNINIDGTAVKDLYNDIFNKTVKYIYEYNTCFNQTTSYVFNKTYTANGIKKDLYTLYSASVSHLLNSISNYSFETHILSTINRLNTSIVLTNNNIQIKSGVDGGEFSVEALKFKKYFNSCDLNVLVKNFTTYYNKSINASTETSNEVLAVYYMKQILEM